MSKNKVKKRSRASVKKSSLLARIAITLGKLMIALIFALGIYSIYLDAKIRQTFEGQRWHVPVQVYGQLQTLQLGERANLEEIAESLIINGYKKVRYVTRS